MSRALPWAIPTPGHPIDVVLIDTSDGRTLRVWQEGGDNAATLLSVLNEDLSTTALDDFLEKWDAPAP